MPSGFDDEIEEMLRKMRALARFLKADSPFGSSQFELPDDLLSIRGESFRSELSDQITSLTTSQIFLDDLNDRDEIGTDPSLGHQRRLTLKEVAVVKNYYLDLMTQVYKLYEFLQSQPKAQGLVLDLVTILPREESNTAVISAQSSVDVLGRRRDVRATRENETNETSSQPRGASNLRGEASGQNFDVREELNRAEQALEDFVDWYLLFKDELSAECTRVMSELEENRLKDIIFEDAYWIQIYHLLETPLGKVNGEIPEILNSMTEFQRFRDALTEALELARNVTTVTPRMPKSQKSTTFSKVLISMQTAIFNERIIIDNCKKGAKKQVKLIHDSIGRIFGFKQEGDSTLTSSPKIADTLRDSQKLRT